MSTSMIDRMVGLVSEGYTPRSVWESSLTYAPGSSVKVNKATTATDYTSGASLTIPEGTMVTIVGVGAGSSGNDHHVQLPDGRQAVVPYYDLGEGLVKGYKNSVSEALTGSVVKVTLSKPLPQSALDFLKSGYSDYGVNLPYTPSADSATSVTFMMKADDQETLDAGLEALKKVAGASYKSDAPATMVDWNK